jgi:hypothetical protein
VSLTWAEAAAVPLTQRLKPMVALLPKMEAPNATWGAWSETRKQPDGSLAMGIWHDSPLAAKFVERAYAQGWVIADFDWGAWDEGREALNSPGWREWIAAASADDLARVLTALLRSERFCEGSLASAFDAGVLAAVLRRMHAILDELTRTP